jgi:hypothetical protein
VVVHRVSDVLNEKGWKEHGMETVPAILGRAAVLWLYESGMAVLGTDTTEPVPFINPAGPTHRAMLVASGVHLLENLNLEDLTHELRYGCREGGLV